MFNCLCSNCLCLAHHQAPETETTPLPEPNSNPVSQDPRYMKFFKMLKMVCSSDVKYNNVITNSYECCCFVILNMHSKVTQHGILSLGLFKVLYTSPPADLTLHPRQTLHFTPGRPYTSPPADLTLHPRQTLHFTPGRPYISPPADLTLHPRQTLHFTPGRPYTSPPADLTLHPVRPYTSPPADLFIPTTSLGSIQPHCNYCMKTIHSDIHIYL